LRLTEFKTFRGGVLPLAPVTLLAGGCGAGRSNALEALALLSALAEGEDIEEIGEAAAAPDRWPPFLPQQQGGEGRGAGAVAARRSGLRGGPAAWAPHGTSRLALGCTVATAAGRLLLDVEIAVDPPVRVVRERLVLGGEVLMETAEEAPEHHRINARWAGGGRQRSIRAPLSSARLVTAQLPLRVAGATEAEHRVLSGAEQMLTALREVFPIDPVPELMRRPVPLPPQGSADARLRGDGRNLSLVLHRMRRECPHRWARLTRSLAALTPASAPTLVLDVDTDEHGARAVLDEGRYGRIGADRMSGGMLRHLALAAVLLTGPDVLDMPSTREVPWAHRSLVVLADDVDAGLGPEQAGALLGLALDHADKGHLRMLAAVQDPRCAAGLDPRLVSVVACRRDLDSGASVLTVPEEDAVDLPV